MKAIRVALLTDPDDRSLFYRARDLEFGVAADSDHVPGMPDQDFHAASALAAQAVARLGERRAAVE
ncbi:MAG: hypothetical protein ACJ77A_05225 [Actinomycetota bacterium]